MSFQEQSIGYLRDEYMPRMQKAVDALDPHDTWWRPHSRVMSVGNILLHLDGNVRQWVLTGLGDEVDRRDREAEFAATGGPGAPELLVPLYGTVLAACEVIDSLEPELLDELYRVQGYELSGYGVIYHVVEHFSWHTGQLVWIAKARGGEGHKISFFDDAALNE